MQLAVEFRGLSRCIETERTCLENKNLNKFIDYENQDMLKTSYKI